MGPRVALFAVAIVFAFLSGARAQTFFGTVGVDNAVGVERGSTALIEPVERPTTLLTLDSFGSEDAGPWVSSVTFALPDVMGANDQVDLTGVVAGPGENVASELRAAGLGYRLRPWGPETTLYINAAYADITPDGPLTSPFSISGERRLLAIGLRRDIEVEDVTTSVVLEARSRKSSAQSFGTPVIDEGVRALFLGVRRSSGRAMGLQTRVGAAASVGAAEFGASTPPGALASAPGAADRFFRLSATTEASLPLSPTFALNAGLVGQWSDEALTVSQKCGFGTNAYSRAFDRSEILGDICLAGRVELAMNVFLPAGNDRPVWIQTFAGVDLGHLRNRGSRFFPSSSDSWSSGSFGIRALWADWIGEISGTRVLDSPAIAIAQEGEGRLWFRAGVRF